MKFDEFIEDVKNKGGVDTDGYYGKQCMDLYNYYCVEVLGLERGKTGANYAKNILNNNYIMQNMQRIDNYPEFVPNKGDVAVGDIGGYGHVCICLGEGDKTYFKSLDQNWKTQQLTEEKHNYLDMGKLVFLRPKNQSNIQDKNEVYKTLEIMRVRDGVWGRQKSKAELTADGQKHAEENGCYKAGTEFTVLEKITAGDGSVWARGYSGYVCLQDKNRVYCVKV